jgi:chemosensory pili system protein ChpA (sensor histidine kinase/response regulator)
MIMIVDDDPELLDELSELLGEHGYRTAAFENGSSALEETIQDPPDLVLLDLQLGGKSGFLIATELTRTKQTSGIPILGITGHYSGKMYADLMNIIGFRGCLLKPLDPEKLLGTIGEILRDEQ